MKFITIIVLVCLGNLPSTFSQKSQQVQYLKNNNVKRIVSWLEMDSLPKNDSNKRILSKELYNQSGLLEKSIKYDIYGDSTIHEYKYQNDSIIEFIKNYKNTGFRSYTKYEYDKGGKIESVFEYTPLWLNLENGYRLNYNKKNQLIKKTSYHNKRITKIEKYYFDKNDTLSFKEWIGPKNVLLQIDSLKNRRFHFKTKNKENNTIQHDILVYKKIVNLNLFSGFTQINQGQILELRTYYNDKKLIDFQEEYLDGKFLSRKLFEYF